LIQKPGAGRWGFSGAVNFTASGYQDPPGLLARQNITHPIGSGLP